MLFIPLLAQSYAAKAGQMLKIYPGVQCVFFIGGMGEKENIVTFSISLDIPGTCMGKTKKKIFRKAMFCWNDIVVNYCEEKQRARELPTNVLRWGWNSIL